MKKRICLMLSAVLLLCTLSGCAGEAGEPVTLSLWHVYGEQADLPMNRLVEEFNATVGQERGIVVTVTNVTSTSKIGSQLQDAQINKPGAPAMPDLFSAHTNTAASVGADKLVDWSEYFSEEELSGYVPEFVEDGRLDGKLVVFPVSKSTYALFVNGSEFERFSAEAGVDYDMLSTWDGFFDAAARYYDWSGGKAFCALDYLIRHVELDVIAKTGGMDYTGDGWYDFDDPVFKASWDSFARALVQGHIIVSDPFSNVHIMTGEVAAGIGSTASIGYYNDTVTYPDNHSEPIDLRVLPLPRTGSGRQYMPQTGVGLAAYKTTEEKAEAAAVFVRWFTEGARNLDFAASTGYMPVNNDAYDAIDGYVFADAGYASLYNAIRIMREEYIPVVRPTFSGYYEKVDALYTGLREMCPELRSRLDSGEPLDSLVNETWEFFRTIA